MDGDGTGYEGVFGFLYSLPWDKMKLGGVYRTGSEISLEAFCGRNFALQVQGDVFFGLHFIHETV